MKKVSAWFLAIMIVFMGIVLLTMEGTDTSGDPENLAEISHKDLENKTIYYVEELFVLDTFATMEDDDLLYMSVMFEDEDGDYTVLNMPVNEDDEIWDDVNAYMDDDDQSYGDLVLNCYVKTETNTDVDGKLHDYFDEWVEYFEDQTDLSVAVTTSLRFDYLCDEDGDPQEIVDSENTVALVMGVLTIVLGLLILYFGALRKPKQKVSIPYGVPTYAPLQPHNSMPGADPARDQLNRYKALKDAGLMSEEEYKQKSQELLGL